MDELGLAAGPTNLGDGYTGRIDAFDVGGQSSFEIHVYKGGKEVGVFGPNGWIKKHGLGEPSVDKRLQDTLNGIRIDELRKRKLLPPKGLGNIKRGNWKTLMEKLAKGARGLADGVCPPFMEDVARASAGELCKAGDILSCQIFLEMGGEIIY